MTRKPASTAAAPDDNSRRARLAARRRHTRVALGTVAAIVIAGAVGITAFALNDQGPAAQTIFPNGGGPKFGNSGTLPTVDIAANQPAARALTHAKPLRLWVGGDSLAGSFGPALGDQVGATGVVQTTVDYKVSSGLWSNDIINWYQRATYQMTSADPEAVVYIIGANDTSVVNQVDQNGDGVPDWQVDYRAKVDRMMDAFIGPNRRTVFWLGPPTLGTTNQDRGAVELGKLMQAEAKKRPEVVYVDTYKLFSTSDGTYSRRIIDENGKEIVARIGDGIHFSEDGAQYLARYLFTLMNARWKLTQQADPANPIGWTLASGSGETVPGFSSAPRPRYRPPTTVSTPTTAASTSSSVSTPTTATGDTTATSVVVTTAPSTTPPTTPPTTSRGTTPPTTKP